jgi:hypothetical protein
MKIEVGNAIFTLVWKDGIRRTCSAPAEEGDFEVVDVEYTGHVTDDEELELEEQAFAIAYERLEAMKYDHPY